jgi:chromosome segregation ATPase
MVITLDDGQTVTIYEDNNLLKQIEPYIDKEIFDLLEDKYCLADELDYKNEELEEKISESDEYIDELREKVEKLEDTYDDLYDEKKELEELKDKILDEINGLAIELSEANIEEIKSKLQDIYYNY